jgi:hypothetical protein
MEARIRPTIQRQRSTQLETYWIAYGGGNGFLIPALKVDRTTFVRPSEQAKSNLEHVLVARAGAAAGATHDRGRSDCDPVAEGKRWPWHLLGQANGQIAAFVL